MTVHLPTTRDAQTRRTGVRASLPQQSVTWRAALLGLLLLVPNVVFILLGYIRHQSRPTTVSLIFTAVITLLLVVAVNALIRHLRPHWALTPAELVTIYVMLSVGSALVGLDQLQTMLPVVAYPHWYATPENDWQTLFLEKMPGWLTVSDPDALWAYYDSRGPLLTTAYWRPWIRPSLLWSGFSLTLFFVMLCLNTFFRRNWVDEAKLSFPIVQLPLEMARSGAPSKRSIFRDRLLWIGFAVAFILDATNGFHEIYPQIPALTGERGVTTDLGRMIHSRPWNAIGWTPLNVFPFVVGITFFVPIDLSFSMWFFYVMWKFLNIFSSAVGWGDLPQAPWIKEQSFGAYMAVAGFSLWASRRHIRQAVTSVLGEREVDDSGEPMPYPWAMVGAIGGIVALVIFCQQAKMSVLPAIAFILLYLMISVAVSRIRAELGSPVHDLHFIGPQVMMTEALGADVFRKNTLIMFAFMHSITRANRSHPMPHQIEGMKLADEVRLSQRGLAAMMMVAAAVALIVGWPVLLDAFFRNGGGGYSGKGREAFSLLERWLVNPGEPNYYTMGAMVWGLGMTLFLTWMRTRYVWWIFHPAGYAVSGSWSMALFAPSILVSWLAKTVILRYGGMGAFAPASTFFLGLILGEFTAGAGWGIWGILTNTTKYNFLP